MRLTSKRARYVERVSECELSISLSATREKRLRGTTVSCFLLSTSDTSLTRHRHVTDTLPTRHRHTQATAVHIARYTQFGTYMVYSGTHSMRHTLVYTRCDPYACVLCTHCVHTVYTRCDTYACVLRMRKRPSNLRERIRMFSLADANSLKTVLQNTQTQ